jgi:transglutaminase-like putative cysteine protease
VIQEQTPRGGSADSVRCMPVPDWVDHKPYALRPPETENACIANGICRLLSDIQVDLCGGELAWHFRSAQRVLTREGAQSVAHFLVDFDPLYQRLDVHFIRVLRGEECIEHAVADDFQLLRRETSLERLALDGRLTASLLIPDVRVDDIVEIGLTLYGSTPVLSGRYAAWAAFDSFNPFFERRHRLLRPLTRKIRIEEYNSPPPAEISVNGNFEDSCWQLVGQKRREAEELTPPWVVLSPTLQFTEFESWNDIASLFSPFYESGIIPDALAAEIDRLALAHSDSEERAAEWLRFVQQKLRYFALSFGEGGLMPRELDAVWRTRFGDCKDAAKLYVSGARRLGLDACAALVSTVHGRALNSFAPSPSVFDHCIVRLSLNGAIFWLDPTMPVQSGDLRNVFQPHDGWALALTPGTVGLEQIGSEKPIHIIHWEDELQLGPKRGSPATLLRHIDCFSWVADSLRNRIANEGSLEYARAMSKELQADWPGTIETKSIEIRDDPAKNCYTLVLHYQIPDCWKLIDGAKGLSLRIPDPAFNGELSPIRDIERKTAIFLGRPRKITRHVRMDMPCSWAGDGWWREHSAPGLTYVDRLKMDGTTISNSKGFVVAAWTLQPALAQEYDDIAKKLRENLLLIPAKEQFGRVRPIASRLIGLSKLDGINAGWFIVILIWIILPLLRLYAGRK